MSIFMLPPPPPQLHNQSPSTVGRVLFQGPHSAHTQLILYVHVRAHAFVCVCVNLNEFTCCVLFHILNFKVSAGEDVSIPHYF